MDVPFNDAVKARAPALDGIVDRPQLTSRLTATTAPAKWLNAPSGTGKSTLVASYARATSRALVWYRFDERDDDPAFFYRHYTAALASALGPGIALPRFSADDTAREEAFADRYFGALRAGCIGRVLLVFDDAHKLSEPRRLGALARFVASTDAAIEIVFISEEPAPAALFDAVAARQLALCNDMQLAFNPEECRALAEILRLQQPDGQTLAALTGGHAGALVLACEFLRGTSMPTAANGEIAEQIHVHLLERLLDRASPARRELLERTSFAPQMTRALAADLAGEAAAAELDPLAARGLLRRVATADGPIYEAHGLVRRGMQAMLKKRLDPAHFRQAAIDTAAALVAHGATEEAFALLIERDAPDEAAVVLGELAERYARGGQAGLLARSIGELPRALQVRNPWLCFWTGQALLGIDEEAARGYFERSYAAFEGVHDRAGMRLAAACVVTAFGLEYGDLRALDAWLARHAGAGGDTDVEPGSPNEAARCLGMVCAAIVRGAFPPGFASAGLIARLRVLIDEPTAWLTRDQPLEAARLLIDCARIFGTNAEAQAMVIATRSHAESGSTSALQRGRWWISAALAYLADGLHEPAIDFLSRARALVEETGSRRLAFELGMTEVDSALKRGELDAAAAHLATLESIAVSAPPAQRAEHARFAARVFLLQGRAQVGLRWAEDALRTATLAGYVGGHARAFQVEYVYALAANERYPEAIALSEKMLEGLDGAQRGAVLALEAGLRYLASDNDDVALLKRAFAHAREEGFVYLLARARAAIARLCERALAHGVEGEFAQRVIAVQKLDPPAYTGPTWPWPVRIRTLGGFELEIRGARYRPAHKAQDKPLELLKLLLTALVLGRDSVDKAWVAERLWPDADGANARKSLDMATSRLRRLLGDDAALESPEGRLRVSPRHVWTDVAPLLRALSRVGERRDEHARGLVTRGAEAVAEVTAVLELYRGPFLPEEDPPPWLIAGREAVTAAVRAALVSAEAILDGQGDTQLVPAMERALAADPTSEDLARALMRAHARHGHHSESLIVYRRVREMLSIVLGVKPSHETERLKEAIHAAAQAGGAAVD
ncbi:MAG: BTAD domain-containing putative transcriptional regulator [Betaproteobacteria bacterium]